MSSLEPWRPVRICFMLSSWYCFWTNRMETEIYSNYGIEIALTLPIVRVCPDWTDFETRLAVWLVVAKLAYSIRQARLILGWVTVCPGTPSRYVTSHLGQLSLPSLWNRLIACRPFRLGLRGGTFTCVGWQVTLISCGRWSPVAVRWLVQES